MVNISQLGPEDRKTLLKAYADHAEVLRGLQTAAAEEAQKFLWATNGGAAVALMAYMGSNPAIRDSSAAWTSLLSFFGGIIALGLLRAVNYHKTTAMLQGWIERTIQAATGQADHEAPAQWLNNESKRMPWLPVALGYMAFAGFIVGSVSAATHLPQLAHAELSATTVTARPAPPRVPMPTSNPTTTSTAPPK